MQNYLRPGQLLYCEDASFAFSYVEDRSSYFDWPLIRLHHLDWGRSESFQDLHCLRFCRLSCLGYWEDEVKINGEKGSPPLHHCHHHPHHTLPPGPKVVSSSDLPVTAQSSAQEPTQVFNYHWHRQSQKLQFMLFLLCYCSHPFFYAGWLRRVLLLWIHFGDR